VSLNPFCGDTLGTFDGITQGTIPNETGQDSQSTRNSEQNGVEVGFDQAVVLKKNTAVGINIGPWVLGLSVLSEDWRNDLVENADELEERIVGKILQSELTLASVTGISLSENSVSESGDDLTRVKSVPESLLHNLNINTTCELLLEVLSPLEHFLVGKTVERTSKTVHTGGEREIRIGESATHQVSGVSRNITTLVIAVDDEVKTHELVEGLVVETKHSVEVGGPIKVSFALDSSVLVCVTVDASSDLR